MADTNATHILAWRKLAGLTQDRLGELMGVTKGAIWKIEQGDTALTFEKRQQMAKIISNQIGIQISGDDLLNEPPTRDTLFSMAHTKAPPAKGGVPEMTLLTYIVEGLVREYGALAVIDAASKAGQKEKPVSPPQRRGTTS